jgi:asparagine synthase (glutamine-hydrolysing)
VCGICGKLNFDPESGVSRTLLKAMADSIAHRGPDDEGYYVSGQIGLGFRRLSIIDLAGGHQPLSNEDGSVWIVFNGEIYNYQELRSFLVAKGHVFRTESDTEVIVHLYEEEGEACLKKLRGMFGFAIWDQRQHELFLARDRVGIKPLYYGITEHSLLFGSEMKALLADPELKRELSPAMIDRFLTFDYVPGDETLLKNIYKIPPGSYMVVKNGKREIKSYWDLEFSPGSLNFDDAREQLLELLEESVRLHMISDVPVGFLLSGGVDSTAMLSLAARKTEREISSFTVGFSDSGFADERPYARLAAKQYGSVHHEITISSKEFVDFLPRYVWHMEEPVCEPPAVALYYVSKLARNYVKVLISGEGGDEAFAGYPNYRSVRIVEKFKSLAGRSTGAVSAALALLNRVAHSQLIEKFLPLLNTPFDSYYFSRTSSPFKFFNAHANELYSSDFVQSISKEYSLQPLRELMAHSYDYDVVSRMLYVDTKTWLPDDLLVKADKITMANSVELRVPLLDHKVLEFAASLPSNFKVRGLATKYIAKESLKDQVPKAILDRKKAGFPVPYAIWLRTDLRDWIHDILMDREALNRNYFQKKTIQKLLDDNLERADYSKELFSLAALELWHREFLDNKNTPPPEAYPVLSESEAARN